MSTGKRLAKRSIIGTRVCAPYGDKYYSGVISRISSNRYLVRFDNLSCCCNREYRECDLIGPGFGSIQQLILVEGQKVFITYNGREITGQVVKHLPQIDEVLINIYLQKDTPIEVVKRIDEVRLLESRKSARLMDQDTDFARLADMVGGDRKRQASHTIDVPQVQQGSRKRRPSSSHSDGMDDSEDDLMDECSAALVLMSLSCSPKSSNMSMCSPIDGSSSSASWRSGTPSPPLSEEGSGSGSSTYWKQQQQSFDEGIVVDYMLEDNNIPRKRKPNQTVFQCTWPGCHYTTRKCPTIEAHVRNRHLGPRQHDEYDLSDHEEEFYYTEVEIQPTQQASPPTMSHQDMARPPHEDPEYQRQLLNFIPLPIPPTPITITTSNIYHPVINPQSYYKHKPRPYPSPTSPPALLSLASPNKPQLIPQSSPSRRLRGENKKCRKVYGMEHRELWCTQCKWKKACSRFGD